jgi:hypothetical protein
VSEDTLAGLAARIEELRRRLEDGELDPSATAEVLEQITRLAQEALDEIERRAEALETAEPGP